MENDCILWRGGVNRGGYGYLRDRQRRRTVRAHRWIWEQTHGPIPAGLVVMHTCDVRACVNPKHLRLGTHAENMADMARKRRSASGTRHHNAKLSEDQVRAILKLSAARVKQAAIAARFGISETNVSLIVRGIAWPDLPRPNMRNKRVGSSKLTDAQVAAIRTALTRGTTGAALAKRYGVSGAAISMLRNGITHR